MSDKKTYWYNGVPYRKIERHVPIQVGACHSYEGDSLCPIVSEETVGQTPSDFSDERDFYHPLTLCRERVWNAFISHFVKMSEEEQKEALENHVLPLIDIRVLSRTMSQLGITIDD